MGTMKNMGTKSYPLIFAKTLTNEVNKNLMSGEMLEKVTPVTSDLLKYWFSDSYCEVREINFHLGQRQAILNTIYIHEVLKTKNVIELWSTVDELLLSEMGLSEIEKDKYNFRKYCIKMSTGTGKTWVMHALLIWQYLNAVYSDDANLDFTKNYLLIAPGLIVYERLLGAFLGKENQTGTRNFKESDFYKYQDLFLPAPYRETIFSFLQSSVVSKDEITQKIIGDGVVVITNWHLLMNQDEDEEEDTPNNDPTDAVSIMVEILPLVPGKKDGNSLATLDRRFSRGNELEYLSSLGQLLVINDEAHHVHENTVYGESKEVEWQKSINAFANRIGEHFIQIDFSATPYVVTGGGANRTKHYFPHIIVDFDLFTAIHNGLVKIIALDKRSELANIPMDDLDFRANRDASNKVISLSAGQKLMLDAGLSKLALLEDSFQELTKNDRVMKYPKMLVICEDTYVSPLVIEYLQTYRDIPSEYIVRIDSSKKGEIKAKEWQIVKQRLFDIDNHLQPKIIVSVLMLREGFDVNNICVIVPLRSSKSEILLEQIVGRGLRLMWRGSDFEESKAENRENLLHKKIAPVNYLDILSIVEHPAYEDFYRDLIQNGEVVEDVSGGNANATGDIIVLDLKDGYEAYDLFFPTILQDKEEVLIDTQFSLDSLKSYQGIHFDVLKKLTKDKQDIFYSKEITVETRFGKYRVPESIFDADCYNTIIAKIIALITTSVDKPSKNRYPKMQINNPQIAGVLDLYIRQKLFDKDFNPFEDENWRILILKGSGIVDHIIKEFVRVCWEMQNNRNVIDPIINKRYLSEIRSIKIRDGYKVKVSKSIFEYLPFPSYKGGFERDFMQFIDSDAEVERFIKVKENVHTFVTIHYLRSDGMISQYYPDFIVKIGKEIYLVETKAQKDMNNQDVIAKKLSAVEWCRKINELDEDSRMGSIWYYSLVSDNMFYLHIRAGATTRDILEMGYRSMKEKSEGQVVLDDLYEDES